MIRPIPKRELTADEKNVLDAIKNQVGREYPISNARIWRVTNKWETHIPLRRIRRIIADLVDAGYPICSTPNKPAGYYWPRNDAEIEDAIETLNNGYARAIHRRVAGLRRIQRGQKQTKLKLKERLK